MSDFQNSPMAYTARHPELDLAGIVQLQSFLKQMGFNADTEHTVVTAHRFSRYVQTLLGTTEPAPDIHITAFPNKEPRIDHMVVVPDITFWSACSHHLLPFFGTISVGYVPKAKLVGLSKIPLLVRSKAKGFWMQEHLANEIADAFERHLEPMGVVVRIEAQHTCQLLDLKQPPIPKMITTVLRGVFLLVPSAKAEFLAEIAH